MQLHTLTFIQDLAVIMLVAGLTTVVCYRLKQPIVLGYIIAGIIIGPYTPPFSLVSDIAIISTLAELGVIFLLFSLGLEFDLHKLSKVGAASFIAATLEIFIMITVGYTIGRIFGWKSIDALFLGALLSISSTTIIIKVLTDLNLKKEKFAQLIFGILIVEDIFAILILALLSTIAKTGTLDINEIFISTAELVSFLVISLLLGLLLIPKIIGYISNFKNDEVLLIAILGLCFGFCLLVIKLDYSIALGAFIIGAIIAEAKQHEKIEVLIQPIRDMFSAIFFVSVGLLFNVAIINKYFFSICIITIVVIIGKILSGSLGVLLTGRDGKTSMRVGMGLAQIGEFSFIIASLGVTLKVTGDFLYSIAVCVAIITTLLTPYLIKYSDNFVRYFSRFIPKNLYTVFNLYVRWLHKIKMNEDKIELKRAVKRGIVMIIINLIIVTAIFLSGAYVSQTSVGILLRSTTNIYLQKTIIWAAALTFSLPFLIAAYRKMRALGSIVAELSTRDKKNNKNIVSILEIISEIISICSIVGIMSFISLLSISILPPIELVCIVLVIASLLIIFYLRLFVSIHSKLQFIIMDVLKKNNFHKKK